MSKSKVERMEKLVRILKDKQMVRLADLSQMLDVSEMTVRRYAGELSDRVTLTGSHLIAHPAGKAASPAEYRYDNESVRNREEKKRVGHRAAALVENDDVIFIDAGTTTPFLVEKIPDDLKFTAVCCSLNAFWLLNRKKNCTIILCGGEYNRDSQIFDSRHSLGVLRTIRITKAFISAAGISKTLGLTCFHPYETDLKKEVIKYSQTVCVLADSTKFDAVKFAFFADLADVHTVITDKGITPVQKEWLNLAGITLIEA